jgi:hypothetical protein
VPEMDKISENEEEEPETTDSAHTDEPGSSEAVQVDADGQIMPQKLSRKGSVRRSSMSSCGEQVDEAQGTRSTHRSTRSIHPVPVVVSGNHGGNLVAPAQTVVEPMVPVVRERDLSAGR